MNKPLDYAFLSITMLMALTSCTSTSFESDEPTLDAELKFAAVEQSRAAVTSNTSIKDAPFAVYGDMVPTSSSNNSTTVFNGTKVTHNGTNWQYDNVQYWVPDKTYSFGAIHPAESNQVSNVTFSNGQLSFTYNYPSDYIQATDVLATVHRRSYTYGTGHPVVFNFRHVLSRINFTVNVDPSLSTPMKILHLSLKNVGMTATYSVVSSALAGASETDDYTGNSWTQPTDQTGTLFDITTSVNIGPGETYEFFKATENPLMLIPQHVSENAEMEITYIIGEETVTASSKIYITTVTAHNGVWLPNRSYTYSFTIGATDVIIFGVPTVKDWNEEEGGNYVITD